MTQRLRSLFYDALSSLRASRVNTQVLMYSTALMQSQTLWQREERHQKNKSMLTDSKAHRGVTDTVLLWSPDQSVNFFAACLHIFIDTTAFISGSSNKQLQI